MEKGLRIIVCGRNGAGKGLFIEYLKKAGDYVVFRPSDVTKKILGELGVPLTRENMSKMMSLLRQEFSPDIYFYAGKKVLDSNKEKSIVFDGIRKLHFIEYLKTQTKCIVVYIDTDTPIRYERIISRGEKQNEQNMTYEQFLQDEALESENEQDQIRNIADIIINNNSTKETLFKEIDTILGNNL